MSRRARTRSSLLGLSLVFLAIPMWLSMRHANGSGGSGGSGFVIPDDFPTTLIRAGLDPKALSAAGIQANGVSAVLQAAADQMNANPTALPNADTALATARVSSDQLLRRIQSGLGSQEDVTAYQTALSSLATATSQRQAALDATVAAAVANLSTDQKNTLAQMRANRAVDFSRDYPTEFLVVSRQETEWVSLRDALANERQAVKYPDLLSDTAQANLATWRAVSAVSTAKNALDANLDGVTTAWNTATGTHQ